MTDAAGRPAEAFCYELPPEKIAQRPVHPYDSAKLLAIDRVSGSLRASTFANLEEFVRAGDLFVFNNTKVIPARLFASLGPDGGKAEILLLEQRTDAEWICLGRPLKKFKIGRVLEFGAGLTGTISERISPQHVLIRFSCDSDAVSESLKRVGVMPIPPYIRKGAGDAADARDYQTFFAMHEGSVAAPTASLHFTEGLVERLKAKGCRTIYMTLHLGTASFLPLWAEGQETSAAPQPPAEEFGFFDAALLQDIRRTKRDGGRIVAVGTSMVRLLETLARTAFPVTGVQKVRTDLFIQPGFKFEIVDCMVTNFHQPRTTHLLLVQAFMGRELLEKSYSKALSEDFRFLSYGDGMIIA
jgi:S-adenosylmethionine:tRNA ribosyltransferase-isomerase